jgi:hypothetical protein
MLREGPIPQAVQGLLEYLAGFLFFAAPFLFHYTDAGIATAASIVVGILFVVLAAMSSGPTGLVKQLTPAVHALLDAILAIVLIAAPFVLGFSGVTTPRNLFLIAGVIWLLVTIGSRYGARRGTEAAPAVGPFSASASEPRPSDPVPAVEAGTGGTPTLDAGTTSTGLTSTGSTSDERSPATGAGTGTVGPDYGPLDGSGGRPPA